MASPQRNGELTDGWHEARLIPVAGIRGQEEQEKRATSCLLAVLQAVPDFGHALLGPVGAPRGRISTYAEVQFRDAEGKRDTPDGAIVVERGKTRWTALVEVKTGDARLTDEQVTRYVDIAREHDVDTVLTISNEITARPEDSPVAVHGGKLRKVALRHLSWWRIITEAVVQHRHRGIADPDQAWILGELIAYLDHEASGASGFQDMGDKWVAVRDGARQGTLRPGPDVRRVSERWTQFIEYLALGLSQDLGRDVTPVRGRKETNEARLDALVRSLVDDGILSASVRVPDAVAPLQVMADLRARQVMTAVTVDAPKEGRPSARINWMLRQLKEAQGDLRIEVGFTGARETTSLLLAQSRDYPERLLSPTDRKREPRSFTLTLTRPMGTKRGKVRGSFVHDTRQQAIDFYRELVQNLRSWRPSAPKLKADEADRDSFAIAQPEPPPFAASDSRDVGDAAQPAAPGS
jgi:hypothetical protein